MPPPTPDPVGVPRWSTAPHVRWAGPADPVDRPLAVLVDEPGGPLDRIAAHPDVTTFLNDRFRPWFLVPSAASGLPPAGTAWFLDQRGCLLGPPTQPASPGAWIEAANAAAVRQAQGGDGALPLRLRSEILAIPPRHPLRGLCRDQDESTER